MNIDDKVKEKEKSGTLDGDMKTACEEYFSHNDYAYLKKWYDGMSYKPRQNKSGESRKKTANASGYGDGKKIPDGQRHTAIIAYLGEMMNRLARYANDGEIVALCMQWAKDNFDLSVPLKSGWDGLRKELMRTAASFRLAYEKEQAEGSDTDWTYCMRAWHLEHPNEVFDGNWSEAKAAGVRRKEKDPPKKDQTKQGHKQSNGPPRDDEKITEADLDMQTLDDFEEREKEWLISMYIPKGCVTLLCSDGGIGKTSIWCDTLAALTAGRPTIFNKASPTPFDTGEKHTVMYFSKEDPTQEVLKGRLRKAGADQKLIRCFAMEDQRLSKIWYGSKLLEKLIDKYKPDIVVFDTLQSFLPDGVDMAKRKDMRKALEPLNAIGAQYGTSFLIVMHTNKSANSGRQRMADSSDIWDLGRSVLMAGRTKDENICYLSHEKSNYGLLQRTILFSITNDGIVFQGTSKKKDRDYIAERISASVPSPKLDEAKDFILENVDYRVEIKELEQMAKGAGISKATLDNARAALKKEKKANVKSTGFGKDKKWYLYTAHKNE